MINIVYQIYLAGGMTGLTFEESNDWRVFIKNKLIQIADSSVKIINPNDYFNFLLKTHETEREVKNYDLHLVRNSDLIIVNFNAPNSIGTAQELAVANENKIPILGLNKHNFMLHPWLVEGCERIFDNSMDLIYYVQNYYLS